MPRRSQPAENPFETATKSYNTLTDKSTVGRTALLNSLGRMRSTGEALTKSQDLGVIKYAIAMSAANTKALEKNDAGAVQPPLDDMHVTAMNTEISTLQVFIDSGEAGGPAAPTDTQKIPTDDRKG